jgi:hypothetical protein
MSVSKKKAALRTAAKVEKVLQAREQEKINEVHKKSGYTDFLKRANGSFGNGQKK